MYNDLQHQALIAAELAKQSGFLETHDALLNIARQIETHGERLTYQLPDCDSESSI